MKTGATARRNRVPHVFRDFRIYAARADEASDPWVWLYSDLPSRSIVTVKNFETRRTVYCTVRQIDGNFLCQYNPKKDDPSSQRRVEIREGDPEALVISQWYRDALGGFLTTATCGQHQGLLIGPAGIPLWSSIRAACHHPDIVARVGTRLGVLGAWLGLTALVEPVFKAFDFSGGDRIIAGTQIAVALVFGVLGWLACRGVKTPAGTPGTTRP